MRTITFYSYKGGVGRTLVVANVAKYLARLGKKVFVIDFDLEAPGLHYKFSLERGGGKQIERGLVDVLLAFTEQRRLPESLAEYVIDIPPPPASSGAIRLMPAGAAPSPAYWRKLSSIDWHELFYSEHPEGVPLFLELKARIEEAFTPDFLLIDARTGITEMGGAATTVLADQVVCLMLKTVETLAGTRAVMRGIQSAPRPDGGGPVELIAVLSRVPTRPDPRGEDAEAASVLSYLNEPGDDLAANLAIREVVTLHTERVLEEKEQLLVGGTNSPHETPLLRDYLRLFTKIIPPEDIGANIGQFANEIRLRAFEDPDGAEADLESLIMSCPHPEAYRALLQLYRLRQSGHEKELRTAFMIWDITRDSADPLLWDAVRTRFNSGIGRRLESPHFTLEFVEAVWRAAGADDAKVGQALAEAYRHGKALDRAAKVLSTCIDNVSEPSPGLAIQAIELFRDMGSLDQAHDVITRF